MTNYVHCTLVQANLNKITCYRPTLLSFYSMKESKMFLGFSTGFDSSSVINLELSRRF